MPLKEHFEKLADNDTLDMRRIQHLAVVLKCIAQNCGCDMSALVSLGDSPPRSGQNHRQRPHKHRPQ